MSMHWHSCKVNKRMQTQSHNIATQILGGKKKVCIKFDEPLTPTNNSSTPSIHILSLHHWRDMRLESKFVRLLALIVVGVENVLAQSQKAEARCKALVSETKANEKKREIFFVFFFFVWTCFFEWSMKNIFLSWFFRSFFDFSRLRRRIIAITMVFVTLKCLFANAMLDVRATG